MSPLSYDVSPSWNCMGSVNGKEAPEVPRTSTTSGLESPPPSQTLKPVETSAEERGTVGTKEGANDAKREQEEATEG